jgi:small nuclear ribonucleoprotein (snRNP)-like protein
VAERKLFTELGALLDKPVRVVTTDGKSFDGTLVGMNPESLSLCLAQAKDEKGVMMHRVFLNGNIVAEVFAVERPFDLRALADRLEKVFPRFVKLYEDQGFIMVMEKIKVTEKGIEAGTSGPAAERVQKVYEQFISEMKT